MNKAQKVLSQLSEDSVKQVLKDLDKDKRYGAGIIADTIHQYSNNLDAARRAVDAYEDSIEDVKKEDGKKAASEFEELIGEYSNRLFNL